MKTIYSPVLSCVQADWLFPTEEDQVTPAAPDPRAYQLLAEIAIKKNEVIKPDSKIVVKSLNDVCDILDFGNGEEVQVIAEAQISSGVKIAFVMAC